MIDATRKYLKTTTGIDFSVYITLSYTTIITLGIPHYSNKSTNLSSTQYHMHEYVDQVKHENVKSLLNLVNSNINFQKVKFHFDSNVCF